MNRRADWRRIRTHLSYTYAEAALTLSVHRVTVRHWVKHCELKVLAVRRPHLILGADLIAFLKARRAAQKRKCGPGEMFCLKCRSPRKPAPGLFEHRVYSPLRGSIVGLCADCGTLMHRIVSARRMASVTAEFNMQLEHHHESLSGSPNPSLNCHSDGSAQT